MDQLIRQLEELIKEYEPVGDDERNNLYENVADGGNFDDTFASGVELGEREMADSIRAILDDFKGE